MRLLDDERGQSVQVGAAILLGFVVIAITIYQVEVVADQNAEVEFNHNEEVRQDLTELRNAISNAGSQGVSESVSVKLGTQYPPRTIFVNPPPVHGQIVTRPVGNLSFGNAQVEGSYDGNAAGLVNGNHSTSRIVYVPRYFELDDGGTTILEHSLAFNVFQNNATNAMTGQGIVSGDRLTLTVLQGNYAEQGTGSVSLDPTTVSGPTDPITITNASSGPIELYLPTRTPGVWNETLGTTFGDDDARVAGYDGQRITVQLDRKEYQLRMALVGVGSGVNGTDRYAIHSPSSNGSDSRDSRYSLNWRDPSGQTGTQEPCDADACTWNVSADTDSQLNITAETVPSLDGVDVDFAVNESAIANVSGDGETTSGTNTATLSAQGMNGTVGVYAISGDGSDLINISIRYAGSNTPANTGPSADFTWSCTGSSCSFDGSSSNDPDGSIVSYDWNFGDSSTGTGSSTSHSYSPPGTYNVSLTVTDDDGATDTVNKTISSGGGISFGQTSTWSTYESVVQQDLSSIRNDEVTIVSVKVNDTPNRVSQLDGTRLGYPEVELYDNNGQVGFADAPSGYTLPADMSLAADGSTAPFPSSSSLTLYLTEFQNNGGNPRNMQGESITITLTYRVNGLTYTSTQTVTVA
ncbi:hypothetical protein L593_14780 [Salinarchaeum sp. Harcht-Bsk1]|uniref:PKD domain-containing protein n=1 Tax=Salinarchaeum sp. Harcht-Bsk1 TaxID=1333523 RepID=UPI0003424362|nr:PKD domain-containing protein [Salinarchaeum sp. Harcht-Bsk1]AGN02890.1 hypothetical protein L593_14780 [Salinarchaeum sp. Harcht-Bsk1]